MINVAIEGLLDPVKVVQFGFLKGKIDHFTLAIQRHKQGLLGAQIDFQELKARTQAAATSATQLTLHIEESALPHPSNSQHPRIETVVDPINLSHMIVRPDKPLMEPRCRRTRSVTKNCIPSSSGSYCSGPPSWTNSVTGP